MHASKVYELVLNNQLILTPTIIDPNSSTDISKDMRWMWSKGKYKDTYYH